MKSLFDHQIREEVIQRIGSLEESSAAQWGKMNVHQMIKHCILCEEMYLGKKEYKRTFIGRIFGKMALKDFMKDEKNFGHNSPTGKDFKNLESTGDLEMEKAKWIALIHEYSNYPNNDFVHWFFGKMTREQVGILDYKHIDHHLRQFNC